jgi:serine/threonine protein phosphatase PrpC
MRAVNGVNTAVTDRRYIAAGRTDPGRQRDVNEDRFHCDAPRGIFIVIDGVGGQAAGGKAADTALSMLRSRLERETASPGQRMREAITNANNEIYRLAATRREWNGMACVLTAALVDSGRATIGHVGDTRLYKLRDGSIQKITRDHSPVGEREDAHELSEIEAMRHPRRNEVYRDVGSEPHESMDIDFVDVEEVSFEPDSALLLCSDGLSDLVDSATILDVVIRCAGAPETIVQTLIEMANAEGGKDNVTVVYVEGEQFAATQHRTSTPFSTRDSSTVLQPHRGETLRNIIIAIALFVIGTVLGRTDLQIPWLHSRTLPQSSGNLVVRAPALISEAIEKADPGSEIIVEPGEYRERIFLKDGIHLVSRVPREAILRLPSSTSDTDAGPAVVATGLSNAEISGFRIVGDSATPLGVGIGVTSGSLSIIDVEVSGATTAGIDFAEGSSATLVGSDIHDNPGSAILVHAGANPRLANNVFTRNGMSERASGSIVVEPGSAPVFQRNVFIGLSPEGFVNLDEPSRTALKNLNWFLPVVEPVKPRVSTKGGRGTRQ